MRKSILALAAAVAAGLAAPAAQAAHDVPYYKLNYKNYDYTYQSEIDKARKFAFFYWDGKGYCRYVSGWNGPGAYEVGTRHRRGYGWDGGYDWQGPGTPADHDDDRSFGEIKADYARDFRNAGECRPHRHYRHRPVVLRRKD